MTGFNVLYPVNKTVDSIIMLRERAITAIAILHSAGGFNASRPSSEPVLEIDSSEIDPCGISDVRALLTSSGLLDPQGHLLRPLHSISLYEILAIVDEGIYPFPYDGDDSFNELPRQTATHVCKQGMYRTMIRELLCHMKVSEL